MLNSLIFRLVDGGRVKLRLVMAIAIFISPFSLWAQTQLFSAQTLEQANLSISAMNRYNALSALGANKSVNVVSSFDVRSENPFDTLYFTLPGSSEVLMAEANLIEDHPTEGFTWSAQLLNKAGSMSLTWRSGQVFGYIQAEANYWEVLPTDGTFQFLVETHYSNAPCGDIQAATPPSGNTVIPPPGPEDCSFSSNVLPYNTCEAIIYVLVVVTPEAKDYIINQSGYNSIDAFIAQGRNLVNQAFANSDIPYKQIVIKWVERDYSSCMDGQDLIFDASHVSDCMANDRQDLNCDVAIALTNGNYEGSTGYTETIGPDFFNAFSIVQASEFISESFALPHELGHLLGARHNWPSNIYGDDDASTCAHAYCWPLVPSGNLLPGVVYEVPLLTSILGENRDGWSDFVYDLTSPNGQNYLASFTSKIRLLNYSNPSVSVGGNPTGRTWADNSKLLRNTACEVADFFQNNHLTVFVRSSPCDVLPYALTASIHPPDAGVPGIGPYTIQWYYNNTLVGTGLTLNIQQHYDCPVYWVECRVTAADGLVIKRLHKIDLRSLWCTCTKSPPSDDEEDERGFNTPEPGAEAISLYPNPVSVGSLTLQSQFFIDARTSIWVYNALGQLVQQKNVIFDITGKAEITVEGFAEGLYLLRAKNTAGYDTVSKFLITK